MFKMFITPDTRFYVWKKPENRIYEILFETSARFLPKRE